MNATVRQFSWNEKSCVILFQDKSYWVCVLDESKEFYKDGKQLFPCDRRSKQSDKIAFDVANLHVLKEMLSK